jgi:magnesium chelatase family protein
VSLAHLGVLFLDELPEFQRSALEALRQPLETGRATIARVNAHVTYPARIQLIAAMNPCRCGHLDNPAEACSQAPKCADTYQSRISGPMFDRIDLHVDVPAVNPADLDLPPPSEASADIAIRVAAARMVQKQRFEHLGAHSDIRANAHADGKLLDQIARPDDAARRLLVEASEKMGLTARGYHRVLKVARTLADLDGAGPNDTGLDRIHIAEALSYRRIRPGRGTIPVRKSA